MKSIFSIYIQTISSAFQWSIKNLLSYSFQKLHIDLTSWITECKTLTSITECNFQTGEEEDLDILFQSLRWTPRSPMYMKTMPKELNCWLINITKTSFRIQQNMSPWTELNKFERIPMQQIKREINFSNFYTENLLSYSMIHRNPSIVFFPKASHRSYQLNWKE